MKENDLHFEPVDFIIQAAHFHRKIDQKTTATSRLADASRSGRNYGRLLAGSSDFNVEGTTIVLLDADTAKGLNTLRTTALVASQLDLTGKGKAQTWTTMTLSPAITDTKKIGAPVLVDAGLTDAKLKAENDDYALIKGISKGMDGNPRKGFVSDFQLLVALVASVWTPLQAKVVSDAYKAVKATADPAWSKLKDDLPTLLATAKSLKVITATDGDNTVQAVIDNVVNHYVANIMKGEGVANLDASGVLKDGDDITITIGSTTLAWTKSFPSFVAMPGNKLTRKKINLYVFKFFSPYSQQYPVHNISIFAFYIYLLYVVTCVR